MTSVRFSIRSLMLLTLTSAFVIWWLASPSAFASRFVNSLDREQYQLAAEMFAVDGENMMLTEWKPMLSAHARVSELSIADLIRGRRRLDLSVVYAAKTKEIAMNFPLEAGWSGIYMRNGN